MRPNLKTTQIRMTMAPARESKIFDLKPELTLAMKLAATFAITYYGMMFLYQVLTVVMYHYSLDSYYLGGGETPESNSRDLLFLIIDLIFSIILVFSLIQIFRKKTSGKAIFVGMSILLIAFQLVTTGFHPWVKYALEVLMLLIIAPIKTKKKIKVKNGKLQIERLIQESADKESDSESSGSGTSGSGE